MVVIFFRYTEDYMKLPIRVTPSMEAYRPGEDELLWNGLSCIQMTSACLPPK